MKLLPQAKLLSQALIGIALSMVVTSAGANIVLSATAVGGGNIRFPTSQMGMTVIGDQIPNLPGGVAEFTSTQTLSTPGTGSPGIETVPPNTLTNLTLTVTSPAAPLGYWFDTANFGFTANRTGPVTITAFDTSHEQFSGEFTISTTGNQFISAIATGGELISSVSIETDPGVISKVAQFRFGNNPTFEPIPLPIVGTGLPGLIAVCGALITLARRRRKSA